MLRDAHGHVLPTPWLVHYRHWLCNVQVKLIFAFINVTIILHVCSSELTANDVCAESVASALVGVVAVAVTAVATLSSMLKMSSSS